MDASNAFNLLIRDVALHNFQHLCPSLSTILINLYREATELFVDGITLSSVEGTTQGDSLALPMYALATVPLISHLGESSNVIKFGTPMMPPLQETSLPFGLGGTISPLLALPLAISPTLPRLG